MSTKHTTQAKHRDLVQHRDSGVLHLYWAQEGGHIQPMITNLAKS